MSLQAYIDQHGIAARLIGNIGETPTVPAAAAALGVPPDHIVKTLLFEVSAPITFVNPQSLIPNPQSSIPNPQSPAHVVVISYGEKRVDKKLLGVALGVSKKHIAFAKAETVLSLIGYPAGGVPPFGHCTALPVLIDAGIMRHVVGERDPHTVQVFAGGGDDATMMEISVGELLRVLGAINCDL